MKVGAAFLLLAPVFALLALALLVGAIYLDNRQIAFLAFWHFGLMLAFFAVYRVVAHAAHCPLCRGSILVGSRAQRSSRAKRLFNSYRLRVAADILVKNRFACPYCYESTRCTVKERRGRQRMKCNIPNRRV